MYKSSLLYKRRPLTVNPELAVVVGLNEAIVLQQVQYWCENHEESGQNFRDGHFWVYNSFPEWQKQFPWWCEKTVKTIFSKLEKNNLLISANYNRLSMDRTKWYRVNHEALDALADTLSPSGKSYPMDRVNLTRPIPESNTKTKTNSAFAQDAQAPCVDFYVENGEGKDIPLSSFIGWYYAAYRERFGTRHPVIRKDREQRIVEELANFLSEEPFAYTTLEGLQAMAEYFFDHADSNDWRINHFACYENLKWLFYETCA